MTRELMLYSSIRRSMGNLGTMLAPLKYCRYFPENHIIKGELSGNSYLLFQKALHWQIIGMYNL
jgi:hypothetical protein